MAPCLALVRGLMRDLAAKAQVFSTTLENCQVQLAECQQRLTALELSSPLSRPLPADPNHLVPIVKCRMLEPKYFSGNRDPRDVGNFLWGLEAYFDANKISLRNKPSLALPSSPVKQNSGGEHMGHPPLKMKLSTTYLLFDA